MQELSTAKGPIFAKVTIPGSKSITHRALILAALANGVTEISGVSIDRSVQQFIKALNQLGIVVQFDQKSRSCIVAGGNGQFPKKQTTIWCNHSKALTRYLLTTCAGNAAVYYFDGDRQLQTQDFADLLNILKRHGAQVIPDDASQLPFTLIGADSLEGGDIQFERQISVQLISALLISAPFTRTPLQIFIPDATPTHFIDLTASMMAEFGVLVHRIHQRQLMVPVPQRYRAQEYCVEPDLAVAFYFFAAAALTEGEILVRFAKRAQSKQTMTKLLVWFERMGCKVVETSQGISVHGPEQLLGIELNLTEFSHAFVIFAMLALFAKNKTRITHIGGIQEPESQLMQQLAHELNTKGIKVELGNNWIDIYPGTPKSGVINVYQNEKLAMAFALLGLRVSGIRLDHMPTKMRSFPDFFAKWNEVIESADVSA